VGTTKHDYWSDNTEVTSVSQNNRYYVGLWNMIDASYGASISVILKPERITFIPPGAVIANNTYKIRSGGIHASSLEAIKQYDTTISLRQTELNTTQIKNCRVHYLTTDFKYSDSPLLFRSFITYSFDEKMSNELYIDNQFYVRKVWEFPHSIYEECNSTNANRIENGNTWMSPKSFFLLTKEGALQGK